MRIALLLLLLLQAFTVSAEINILPYKAYAVNGITNALASGDLNNDGRNDFVVVTGTNSGGPEYKIYIYYQDSLGQLVQSLSYSYPYSLAGAYSSAIADLNNDGRNDFLITYDGKMAIYHQNAAGTFNTPQITTLAPWGVVKVVVDDLNNDGLADIVADYCTSTELKILYQTATGFTTSIYEKPKGSFTDAIEIGDVNNDGKKDIVYCGFNTTSPTICVFTQKSPGGFNNYVGYTDPTGIGLNAVADIAIGDINNDGLNDIIGTRHRNMPDAKLVVWIQDATTNAFGSAYHIPAYEVPDAIVIDDLDCDGKNEIIVAHGSWSAVTIYSQNIQGGYTDYRRYFTHHIGGGLSPFQFVLADADGDDRKDICFSYLNSGLVIFKNISLAVVSAKGSYANVDTIWSHKTNFRTEWQILETIDTAGRYYTITTDTISLLSYNLEDSLVVDSVFYQAGQGCGGFHADTVIRTYHQHNNGPAHDTTWYGRRIDSISIDALDAEEQFLVSPNPMRNRLRIVFKDHNALYGISRLELLNLSGQKQQYIYDIINFNVMEIDVSHLSTGMYILDIWLFDKRYRRKLLKSPIN